MNCFTFRSNEKIEFFLKTFNERIKQHYPEAYQNFKKSKPISVSGWPTPKFDLINVTFEEGYDYYHPSNWNKEILNQEGIIAIQGENEEFTFGGHNNIIDHFRMPIGFHKTFEFDSLTLQKKLKKTYIRNTRAIKRFKSMLKKDYLNILSTENIFIRMVNERSYIAIKELKLDSFLAFNTKYEAVILNYKSPNIFKRPNSGYIELTDRTEIIELKININEILKNKLSVAEIQQIEKKNTSM